MLCNCGDKQYLVYNENGYLSCSNCHAEQTSEELLDLYDLSDEPEDPWEVLERNDILYNNN